MKRALYLLVAALAVCLLATAGSAGVAPSGLVAAYGFDEGTGTTLGDSSGNGNHGVISGATWSIGRYGKALAFDGIDDWVTVADAASLDLADELTIEAWVLPTELGDEWRTVAIKEQPGDLSYALYGSGKTAGVPSGHVHVGTDTEAAGPAALPRSTWSHLATTFDGASIRLYVNGVLVSTVPAPGTVTTSDSPFRLGGNDVWEEWFKGRIDEVRVYNRALDAAEIASDMSSGVTADSTAPELVSQTPAAGATDVPADAVFHATFSEAMNPATISSATITLRDGAGAAVPATVTFDELTSTATIDPAAALSFGVDYEITIGSGATDRAGNPLSPHAPWTIATQTSAPPLLLITSPANPFSSYYAEILRAEGLNAFTTAEISSVSPAFLAQFHVALLGEMPLGFAEESMLANWVDAGGNLVAMRPDKDLAGLLGLTATPGTLTDGYLQVDTTGAPGAGIVGETMQFHGTADVYTLNGATQVAELFSTATAAHARPAVSVVDVGTSGGQAAAFAYDLARSVVYTRQGNPAWAGQDRDGVAPIRPHDLFYGGAEPDWVDLDKVDIPQADEQQRLLANLLAELNSDQEPLPRFWYLPRGEKAAVVMTGDDHGFGGTALAFDRYKSQSAAGCAVALWECIRSTSYIYANSFFGDTQAAAYTADGFEVGLHVSTDCLDYTPESLENDFDSQLGGFMSAYPGAGVPETNRTHCIAWSDWATQPKVELTHGIRFDTNYYFYPDSWVQNRPGMMTGSALPMRFADVDGSTIDVYQATTQMTDESGQAYPFTSDALLDKAIGPEGYYGVYTVNAHTDSGPSAISDPIVASAVARGVPVVSSLQMLRWVDGRNDSSFRNFSWVAGTLRFAIAAAAGSDGLQALLPLVSGRGTITGITRNGAFVPFSTRTVKGVDYASFDALGGEYSVLFDTSAVPVVIARSPAVDEGGVPSLTTVTATFSTAMNAATITNASFTLVADATGDPVPATVSYDPASRTATLTPTGPLAHSAFYTAGLDATILGASGTAFAGESWGFGTGQPTVVTSFPAEGAVAAPRSARIRATFSSRIDPATITNASFTLETAAGAPVAGAVSYDAATGTASFDPASDLVPGTSYVARLTAAVQATDGTPLVPASWTFTTTSCPCSLFPSSAEPAIRGIATGGTPLELGVKVRVDEPVVVTALRYFKDSSLESGPHVGRVWNATGAQLASVTFVENLTSGWQQKSLPTPLALAPGTYVFSVNANDRWGTTQSGLATEIVSGPIRTVADGVNGVFSETSGTFPTSSFSSSNYFVDLVAVAQGELVPPVVESTTPVADATDVPRNPVISATFSPLLDPATIDESTFTLRPAGGSDVPATVTYDTATGTALLTPVNPLVFGTTYTATVSTGVEATDGTPLEAPYSWSFTMRPLPPAPVVLLTVPADGASDLGPGATPRAEFDRALDPTTVTGATITLTGPGGAAVPATVSYEPATLAASLDPVAPLTLGATYTATLAGEITAEDGGPLGTPHSWSFTVAASDPGPPAVSAHTPEQGATGVLTDANVTATFSRSLDPATIDASSFTLTPDGGTAPVPATVTSSGATATLDPASALLPGTTYTATLSTAVEAADGTALAAPATWSFTTASCPCSLFQTTLTPTSVDLSTANGRSGPGPFSLELGVKIRVDQASLLRAVRFYKDAGETGAHTITLWTPDGAVKLQEIAFSGETASGWQTQALATPYSLEPGNDYVVSVNANDRWVSTLGTFSSELVSGPVHSVVGANGVYAEAAGEFPTLTFGASNYFVDVVVDPNPVTPGPTVILRSPAAGATDVLPTASVEARFSRGIAVGTISESSFTLQGPDLTLVPATVAYTAATNTAVLHPAAPLAYATTYTATLSTAVTGADGTPLDAEDSWTFTTAPAPPSVLETFPADASVGVETTVSPTATFSRAMDAATITDASFTLTPDGGTLALPATVTYDALTRTATLDPLSTLEAGATFVARLQTAIAAVDGTPLAAEVTWTFETDPNVDTTPPSVPTLALSAFTAAAAVDSTVYFRPGAPAGGGFTVVASSTDPDSPVTITYPSLGAGWSGTDGVYSFSTGAADPVEPLSVTATNGAGLTASAALVVTEDSTPPAGASISYATGYDADGVVSIVTDSGADTLAGVAPETVQTERQLAALVDGACAPFPADWEPSGAESTIPDGNCGRFRLRVSDRVGNEAVVEGGVVLVDLTAPAAPALALSDSSADVHAAGTTAYYRPAGSGSFDVAADAADTHSGILDYSFPTLAGFTASGTGASRTYALATPTEPDGAKPVTVRNNALLTSAASSFTLAADSSAPTGGALLANGVAATSFGTSSYDVDGAFALVRTDYDTDAGSGVASSVLTRADGVLAAGACSGFGAPTPVDGSPAQSGLATGCYRYVLTGTDNVGNTTSVETVVKVDTSDPIAPALTLSDSSADVHTAGTTAFYRPAGSGSFAVAASSSDADSGIAGYGFPTLAGFTSADAGATRSYTLATPTEADGAKPVTALNNAGRTSATDFTLTADSTAPDATITCTGGCAPWHTTTPVSVGLAATDTGGAGVREIRYTTNGSDPTTGTVYTTALSLTVTTTVRYAAFDHVGNVATGSQLVQIDTTAPSSPTLTLSESASTEHVSGTTLFYNTSGTNTASFTVTAAGTTDAQSGIADVTFPAVAGMTGGGADTTPAPYSSSYTWTAATAAAGAQTVTVRNGAGLTSTAAFTVTRDVTPPTGGSVTYTNGYVSTASVTVTAVNGNDGTGSGLNTASGLRERDSAPLANGVCGAFGGAWTTVVSPDTTVVSGTCYRYRYTIADNVGNAVTYTSTNVVKVDTSPPATPVLTVSENEPDEHVVGTTLYYNSLGTNSGSFTVDAVTSDPQSTVSKVNFARPSGFTGAGDDLTAPYQGVYAWTSTTSFSGNAAVTATNGANATSAANVTITRDETGPAAFSLSEPLASARIRTGAQLSAAPVDAGAGVASVEFRSCPGGTCTYATSTAIGLDSSAPFSVSWSSMPADGQHTLIARATDNVGNVTDSALTTVTIDNTPPATSLQVAEGASPGRQYFSDGIFYYNPAAAGDFRIVENILEAPSGIQQVDFPAITGVTGFTGTASTDTTAPYESSPYAFATNNGTAPTQKTITVSDLAGNTQVDTVSFVRDVTTPAAFAVTAPSALNEGDAITANASDAGSGIEKVELRYCAGAGCTYAASTLIATSTASPYGTAWTGQPADGTYTLLARAFDNVGNTRDSSTTTVTVDNTLPSLTLGVTEGLRADLQHLQGGTLYYNPAATGDFTVTAAAADASGIAAVDFPGSATTGFTGSASSDTVAPFESAAYTFAPDNLTAPAALTVTVADGAGNTRNAQLAPYRDTAAPVNGSVAYADGYSASGTVTVATTDGDDGGGAGIDAPARTLERRTGTLDAELCGSFGAWGPATSPDSVPTGTCAAYRYRVSDLVGNTATFDSPNVVKVDTTAPAAPSLAFSAFSNAIERDGALYFRPGTAGGFTVAAASADQQSGIASYSYPGLGAGWSNPGDGGAYSFDATALEPTGTPQVTATNRAGSSSAGTALSVIADSTGPLPTVTCSGGCGGVHTTTVSVTLDATDAGSGLHELRYTTDGGDPQTGAVYSGPIVLTETATVRYAAFDRLGNVATGSQLVEIDTTAPSTTILTGPADPTNATNADFTFTSTETGSSFECRLDGGAWSACTSPQSYGGLADGAHTFDVRATDAAGNTDLSPATAAWTIDTSAPDTEITAQPADPSGSADASFSFASTKPDPSFQCRLDGAPWSSCASPRAYTGLADGAHTFDVRATDGAGNTDPSPATFTWTVDTAAPTGSITAPADAARVRATIAVSSDSADTGTGVGVVTFERSPAGLDSWTAIGSDSFAPYAVGLDTTTLADGAAYDLRAVTADLAGNTSSSATVTVTVDNTAPATSIGSGPADPTSATGASFTFGADDAGASFECRLDGGSWSTCASPQAYTGLSDGSHTFEVRATDAAGNVDSTPAGFAWTIDTTAPVTTITSGPASPTSATAAGFAFAADEAATFECRLDGGAWTSCSTPVSHTGLSEGTHTFEVRATDPAGNTDLTPAAFTWTIDTTAPDTTILSAPADPTNSSGAAFTSGSTEADSTFECRLDGGPWQSCPSAQAYALLTEGPHTFEVRATDAAANTDATPASFTWSIDWTSPTGSVTAPADGAHIRATYLLASDSADAGSGVASVVFERRAAGSTGPWTATPASFDTTLAADGVYDLRVVTADVAGNVTVSSPIALTVDNTPPATTITARPADPTNATAASFSFESNEAGSTFEVRLDGGAWSPSASPQAYSGLSEGTHTFEVRATDVAGNLDASAASSTWTIDTTAPVTSITAAPADPTSSTDASFSFGSNEPGSTFEVRLDGGAWSESTSPKAYSGLSEGAHTFEVRAVDAATNVDATPASSTWTVDTTAPETSLATRPADPSSDRTPTFTFTSTASPAGFECNLDGAGWVACATPFTVSAALADGSHTFEVRSTDAAGNQDGSAAGHTWVVDGTDPTGSVTAPAAGAAVSGAAVTVASDSADAASGVLDVLFERRAAGAGSWTAIGSPDTSAPYEVSLDTTGLADGDYELRATTRDVAGNQFTSAARTVIVDNTAPTLSVEAPDVVNLATADPASITAAATDAGTGVASVEFEQCTAANDATCAVDSWKPLGLDTTAPYGVAWPIPTDGTRLLRVRASDGAGHRTTRLVLTTVDRTVPAGAMTAPTAANLRGAVTLAANASDTAPGAVDSVTFQRSPAGAGTWTDVATDSATPYEAALDTTALADGLYDFRVTVTDRAGNTAASAPVASRRVDNTAPSATMVDPGDYLRGTVALASTQSDSGSGIDTVVLQRQGSAGGWVDTPASFDTTAVADGLYDFRVVVTDNAGNTTNSAPVTNRRVDNTAPSATMLDPGAFLRGTVALTSSRSDAGSGVASFAYQRREAAGAWIDTAESFDTTAVADGLYDFRVLVTDRAGNSTTSAALTGRRVDNTPPTATITPVAALIRDTVTLASTGADAGSGVGGTTYQRRPVGGSEWVATPQVWDTKTVPDGHYELRAVVTDNAGNSTASTPVSTQIDNTGPRIVSQNPAAGATDVSPELVPSITFSRAMDATSFTATSVTLKKADGTVVSANRSYNAAANTLYIGPLWPLDYVTTYVVSLDTTVKAQDGIPLAVPYSFSFTTSGTGINKRVNAGGPALTTLLGGDFLGATFLADGSASGGLQRSTTNVISGTTDPALYRDERYGSFTYTIKVPNGTYDVILHFAEWNAVATNTHVFGMDVLETSATDIPSLDLTAVAGRNRAYKRTIANVTTSTSSIRIKSIPISLKGDPTLAAIEVISKR